MRRHAVFSLDEPARMVAHVGSVAACTLRSLTDGLRLLSSGGRNRAGGPIPVSSGAELNAENVLGSSQNTIADRSPSGPPGPIQLGRFEGNVGSGLNRLDDLDSNTLL